MSAASEPKAQKDRIRDLEAQLEYTHTHYQKLLEQVCLDSCWYVDCTKEAHSHPAYADAAL